MTFKDALLKSLDFIVQYNGIIRLILIIVCIIIVIITAVIFANDNSKIWVMISCAISALIALGTMCTFLI